LNQVWKTTGSKPKELADRKPLKAHLNYLLDYYAEIKTEQPIDHKEIHCWSKLTGNKLTYFEIQAIRAIDQEYISTIHSDD
jgi:hypothetical protein